MTPAQGDLRVYRWVPNEILIPFVGFDFEGDLLSATMQVRLYRDQAGAALINLEPVTNLDDQGLTFAFKTEGGITTSTLRILLAETTIEQLLPNGLGEIGKDIELVYAVHIRSDAFPLKQRWLEGKFIIVPGANAA